MKKIAALLLAILVVLSLCACGSDTPAPQQTQPTEPGKDYSQFAGIVHDTKTWYDTLMAMPIASPEMTERELIDEVVFEDIQLQDVNGNKETGIKTFKVLAEVFGVIHELLTEIEMDYIIVPPIVWKATFKIAGKGRAQEKKMSQAYIKATLGRDCTEDEADAACIGLHVLHKQKTEYDWS